MQIQYKTFTLPVWQQQPRSPVCALSPRSGQQPKYRNMQHFRHQTTARKFNIGRHETHSWQYEVNRQQHRLTIQHSTEATHALIYHCTALHSRPISRPCSKYLKDYSIQSMVMLQWTSTTAQCHAVCSLFLYSCTQQPSVQPRHTMLKMMYMQWQACTTLTKITAHSKAVSWSMH